MPCLLECLIVKLPSELGNFFISRLVSNRGQELPRFICCDLPWVYIFADCVALHFFRLGSNKLRKFFWCSLVARVSKELRGFFERRSQWVKLLLRCGKLLLLERIRLALTNVCLRKRLSECQPLFVCNSLHFVDSNKAWVDVLGNYVLLRGLGYLCSEVCNFLVCRGVAKLTKKLPCLSLSNLARVYVSFYPGTRICLKPCISLPHEVTDFLVSRRIPKRIKEAPSFGFSNLPWVYIRTDGVFLVRFRSGAYTRCNLFFRRCEPKVREELFCLLVRRCLRVVFFSDVGNRKSLGFLTNVCLGLLISECDTLCKGRCLYLVRIQEPWVYVCCYICSEISLGPCARKLGDLRFRRCEPRIGLNKHIARFSRRDKLSVVGCVQQVIQNLIVRDADVLQSLF